MDETAVLVNIGDMIDLAIGTPEVGIVDFNMLQTVLHCLAQQLRILGKNVELRGSVAALPIGRDNVQTIAISEFVVETDAKTQTPTEPKVIKKKAEVPPPTPSGENETILVVERVKKNENEPAGAPSPGGQITVTSKPAPPAHEAPRSQSVAPPPHPPARMPSSEKLSLVTLSKFNLLENAVEDLKNRVYGSMPKNEEILEEVRSQTNLKAITDMWTSLNVSSRLEAAEAGLAKLSSLVQDLIGETTELQDAMKRRASRPAPPATAPSQMAPPPAVSTIVHVDPAPSEATGLSGGPLGKEELDIIQANLQRMRADLDGLTTSFYAAIEEIQAGLDKPLAIPPPSVHVQVQPEHAEEHAPPPERRQTEQPRRTMDPSTTSAAVMERLSALEKRLKECCDSIGKNEGVIQDQINSFQDQIEYLMKQVAGLTQDLSAGKLSPDLIKDLQGLMHLFQTVQEMQEQLKQVHDTALQLAAEKEDRQHHMNALLEQIELLKTIKLDREDMIEAMAEKADLRLLARKVSHDQFEMACDDLSRGLEHALGKLNIQEALWQQALDDIQREIETKLDKMELSPVKEFFNNKLKQLQENLKQMALLRREAEAAGTKKRLLRDVNCISCDAKAVMAMETEAAIPISKPLPANLSMKPYLSYELDAIRKAQASNLPQRNMHDWETIDKQMGQPKQPQKVRSETDKHICNRYCGGSHTVTTPAQRVARLGHFIKQWGPDVLPLSSGMAAGDDGRMYKVSPVEGANVGPGGAVETTCTPKSPTRKSDAAAKAPKPIVISAECHCLEGGGEVPNKGNPARRPSKT